MIKYGVYFMIVFVIDYEFDWIILFKDWFKCFIFGDCFKNFNYVIVFFGIK